LYTLNITDDDYEILLAYLSYFSIKRAMTFGAASQSFTSSHL